MSRPLGGLLTAVVLALLTACTSTPQAAPPTIAVDPVHGPADVAFAQGMIPHHQQAVAMSRLADTRAASPQVTALAARIEDEQGPEIEQMTAMLTAWGAPAGQPMGMTGMPGMMGPQEMADLVAASGPAFDRAFLTMMIAHHAGAVEMAQTELAQGTNPQARTLARSIIVAQRAEIDEMQRLLAV
ncbi:DUF305 domain-containing protein [Actinomycetospora sp. NBRC 106378]|uniref:DUF305 domain-containing protein n=1 Tax=Actinomycetospora sp. NBRC 106378 TaxID=3032208 RepID=UPI00249FD7D4|nr:DUF305 domain-containing protein [Actinomycetospora sp. NBRC 106378]GLZ56039.1 hypothetical protein Acsp07_56560 [Actinomycetospora sp. NBRC 106378]